MEQLQPLVVAYLHNGAVKARNSKGSCGTEDGVEAGGATMSRDLYPVYLPPKPKGFWVIGKNKWGQTQFAMYTKPNILHRLMTKLLLGWDWLDND